MSLNKSKLLTKPLERAVLFWYKKTGLSRFVGCCWFAGRAQNRSATHPHVYQFRFLDPYIASTFSAGRMNLVGAKRRFIVGFDADAIDKFLI